MTRYTAVWRDEALSELAEIWTQAKDRAAVTSAVESIDSQLAHDPATKGNELHEGLRQLVEPPVRVLFEIREPDRLARVVKVGLARG